LLFTGLLENQRLKDKIKLFTAFLLLSVLSFLTNLIYLFAILIVILLCMLVLQKKTTNIKIIKKVIFGFLPVMIPLAVLHYIKGFYEKENYLESSLILFIRSFDMTLIIFIFIEHTNMIKAISFSRNLTFLFTIAYSQTEVYRRILTDFKEAKKSRTLTYESYPARVSGVVRQASYFIQRAIHDSEETSNAMKSRGFGL